MDYILAKRKQKIKTLDSKIEELYKKEVFCFNELKIEDKINYINDVKEVLKKNVIGAFYTSLKRIPYSFNNDLEILVLNLNFKNFLNKNKEKLEQIIDLRIFEFLKISEKDEEKLFTIFKQEKILNYKQNFYNQINYLIDELIE